MLKASWIWLEKLDLGSLSNIASLFAGGASSVNGLMNSGGGIVDALLGNKTSGVLDLVTKLSGMKSGSSSSLLKNGSTVLMGIIGNQIKGKGLGFLTDLLSGQKKYVNDALPGGMGSLLGFANLGSTGSTSTKTTSSHHTSSNGGGNNWLKWLLPLLLAAVWYWLSSRDVVKRWLMLKDTQTVENTANAVDAVDSLGKGCR